jgi:hypothetical protein
MSSQATGLTAMEELQQAMAMPDPSLTRTGNNSNSATARRTRYDKFTAIVKALRQMKMTGQLPPNILDNDDPGDLKFDSNSLEDKNWNGAMDTYNQLSANDQALMLNNAIAQANFVLGQGGMDEDVVMDPPPQTVSHISSLGQGLYQQGLSGSNSGSGSGLRINVSGSVPQSPQYVPPSPTYSFNAPQSGLNTPQSVGTKDDSGGGGGGIAAAIASQSTDLAQQRATTFDASTNTDRATATTLNSRNNK